MNFILKLRKLEYPFKKSWVLTAALMAIISIIFAVLVLSGEEDVVVSVYTISFIVHPLVLYFLFVSFFTTIMFILKVYLYTLNEEEKEDITVISEEERERRARAYWKWSFITLIGLIIASFFIPVILLNILSPLWWFISICGFVPGITLPEVILFFYYEKRKGKV